MIFVYRTSAVSRETSIGDIDVETEIILNENGTPLNYIIVNQGKPGDMYDDSCNGTWCLRKDIAENRQWHSSNANNYANSTVNAYLNGDWLNRYDPEVAEAIKQVKIPYRAGSGYGTTVTSGVSGLSVKAFLLSATELSFNMAYMPVNEGAELQYFSGCADDSPDSKRISFFNNEAAIFWMRSPYCNENFGKYRSLRVYGDGSYGSSTCSNESGGGIRPCIILPYDFKLTNEQIGGVVA